MPTKEHHASSCCPLGVDTTTSCMLPVTYTHARSGSSAHAVSQSRRVARAGKSFAYVHLDLANAASPGIIVSSRSRSRPAGAPLLSRPSVAALAILIIGVGAPRLQKFNRFQPYPPRPHLDFGAYLSHVLVTKIPSDPVRPVSSSKSGCFACARLCRVTTDDE